MIDYSAFIKTFPEFSDPAKYPQATAEFFINLGYQMYTVKMFRTLLDYAVSLFVAHSLTLNAREQAIAQGGGVAGTVSGPMTSKTVGPISASYDISAMTFKDAGAYNSTMYGIQLYTLMRGLFRAVYVPGLPRRGFIGL